MSELKIDPQVSDKFDLAKDDTPEHDYKADDEVNFPLFMLDRSDAVVKTGKNSLLDDDPSSSIINITKENPNNFAASEEVDRHSENPFSQGRSIDMQSVSVDQASIDRTPKDQTNKKSS